jgi:hypothetical protein
MTLAGAAVFGLVALVLVAFAAIGRLIASDDDDDADLKEYDDWGRLRLASEANPAHVGSRLAGIEKGTLGGDRRVPFRLQALVRLG